MDDFKNYIEARLGKPSHLLEGDKLKQFLLYNKQVRPHWLGFGLGLDGGLRSSAQLR